VGLCPPSQARRARLARYAARPNEYKILVAGRITGYYYAHLDRYAPGLKEGALLRTGEVLGSVGTTGNAPKDPPHFAISKVASDRRWWGGTALHPFLDWHDPSESSVRYFSAKQ
jgi:hypothetical protein